MSIPNYASFTEVIPGTSVRFNCSGCGVGEADFRVFLKSFYAVWENIDREDQIEIERLWTGSEYLPTITLQSPWLHERDNSIAHVEHQGKIVEFDWDKCNPTKLPSSVLEVLIAHEMGHVYQWATGLTRLHLQQSDLLGYVNFFPDIGYRAEALVEIHADDMVEKWGYKHATHFAYRTPEEIKAKPQSSSTYYNEAVRIRARCRQMLDDGDIREWTTWLESQVSLLELTGLRLKSGQWLNFLRWPKGSRVAVDSLSEVQIEALNKLRKKFTSSPIGRMSPAWTFSHSRRR